MRGLDILAGSLTMIALVACSRGDSPTRAAGATSVSSHPVSAPPPLATAPPSASAPTSHAPVTVIENGYGDAMAAGRSATTKKDWPKAVAAFTKALAAKPDDARAYAERGYARLLEGRDLGAADEDLKRAADIASERKLRSQIWFNRGLVAEKTMRTDDARVDFFLANRLSPSAAARGKIGAAKVCPVFISRSNANARDPVDDELVEADNWEDLWCALADHTRAFDPSTGERADASCNDPGNPTSAAAAREALTGQKGDVTLPRLITTGDLGAGKLALVILEHGTKLRAMQLGHEVDRFCPGKLDFQIVSRKGDLLHVHGLELWQGDRYTCIAGGDEEGKPYCMPRCEDGAPTEHDVVIDLAKGDIVLAIERPFDEAEGEESMRVSAKLEPTGLRLSGLGCEGLVPFVADAGVTSQPARPR